MKTDKAIKLVVFDVEGVLVPKNLFAFEIGRRLGLRRLMTILATGFLYYIYAMSLTYTLERIYRAMKGITTEDLDRVLEKMWKIPGIKEVFATLKARGYKIALISSGLPTSIVKKIAGKIDVNYAFGVETEIDDANALTGRIYGDVIENKGKQRVLLSLLDELEIDPSECAVIADDRNNSSMFISGVLKIGYTPDFVIRAKADRVITGSLSGILPILERKAEEPRAIPPESDFIREGIHASGVFIPALALLFGQGPVALFIILVMGAYLISELSRLSDRSLPFFSLVTKYAASKAEYYDFVSAPLYFGLGILLTLLLFKPPASFAAIACFAFGDSSASLVGASLGRTVLPLNKSKTLEGSLAGFIFAFLGALLFVSPPFALLAGATAMAVEFLPLPINDNIMMPLCAGLVLTLIG